MSLYMLAPNTTGSWCFGKEGLYLSPSTPRLLPSPQGACGLAAVPWGGLASAVTALRRAETFLRVGLLPPAGPGKTLRPVAVWWVVLAAAAQPGSGSKPCKMGCVGPAAQRPPR